MTREEKERAIATLRWLHDNAFLYFLYSTEEGIKFATEEGIKALEQEPCEDAISRQAVLVTARNSCADLVSNKDTEIFCDEIKALPPVTSHPKTGEWIFVDKAHEHAHCSECDHGDVDLLDGRPHNYCPNCGAKMVEPHESEVSDADNN